MASTRGGYDDKFLKDLNPFKSGIPGTPALFLILLIMSMIIGISSVALVNYSGAVNNFRYVAVSGSITGILAIMLPTLLTVLVLKSLKRYVGMKYIFFIALVGTIAYSIFILLGGILYALLHIYSISIATILLGDASIFAWWFFASKIVMGQKKNAIILALIQPTLNAILYLPASSSILGFKTPFNILLLKLYAGMSIFLVISYAIIYIVDRPYKKNFGFHSFDAISQMVQNWLFDINASAPFGQNFGTQSDVRTDTLVFRNRQGAMKAIFFAPNIHYGPSGTLAGSDFPYMLERYSNMRYKVPTFIMHCAVDMGSNPVSSSQFNDLRNAFEQGMNGKKADGMFTYSQSRYGDSSATRLGLGDDLSLVTLTRAPRVTEDIAQETATLFNELLEAKFGPSIIIDAHNSRYETAPKEELDGAKFNSKVAKEYITAIKDMDGIRCKAKNMRMGAASTELHARLGNPVDLARGNLNVAVFRLNGFKYAMIQFNSNNMLPQLRNQIVGTIKRKYRINAEVYTTDTHAVNSPERNAANVLGRQTKYAALMPIIEQTLKEALADMETVSVHHGRHYMKRFKVWGANTMESMITVAKSIYGMTRVIVPIIIAIGFIAAAWIILAI